MHEKLRTFIQVYVSKYADQSNVSEFRQSLADSLVPVPATRSFDYCGYCGCSFEMLRNKNVFLGFLAGKS